MQIIVTLMCISRLKIWLLWFASSSIQKANYQSLFHYYFVFCPEKAGAKENKLLLLCLLLSCGLNDRNLLLQWHKATGKCFAGAVIYVTSCSSSLSREENHPEEQWLSLRQ